MRQQPTRTPHVRNVARLRESHEHGRSSVASATYRARRRLNSSGLATQMPRSSRAHQIVRFEPRHCTTSTVASVFSKRWTAWDEGAQLPREPFVRAPPSPLRPLSSIE